VLVRRAGKGALSSTSTASLGLAIDVRSPLHDLSDTSATSAAWSASEHAK
jgi:hypothetical protein